jgi:hypothetical protein
VPCPEKTPAATGGHPITSGALWAIVAPLAINPLRNKLERMAENDETPTVTIEVEMADSSDEPESPFESVIKVRIIGSERHACELVKDAVLLAIQTALGGDGESRDAPTESRH